MSFTNLRRRYLGNVQSSEPDSDMRRVWPDGNSVAFVVAGGQVRDVQVCEPLRGSTTRQTQERFGKGRQRAQDVDQAKSSASPD
jgi:hypothetical protein